MRATIILALSFELGTPDDYPEEVATWEAAAEYEAGQIAFVHALGVDVIATRTIDRLIIKGDAPFKRTPEEEE